ncbi:MAG: DegV family protein [Clostridia bacterium]|nr:DegV family protein [Clostridia bacterium]
MKWNIIADSSCDLREFHPEDERISFASVPFVIRTEEHEFTDDLSLSTEAMIDALSKTKEAGRTSCPSPDDYAALFPAEGNIVMVTISSNLSGSYNSACLARDMLLEKDPSRNVAVIDSKSAGPELTMIIRRLYSLIDKPLSFDEIVNDLNQFADRTETIFALTSFDNLVKNGRVGRIAGFVAGKLGMCGIGVANDGRIDVKSKVRGTGKALRVIIDDMKAHAYAAGPVLISHCLNEELARRLKELITESWPAALVDIMPTRGLCSFYAEKGGLIIAY